MIITYLSVSHLVISDYYLPVCLTSSDYWLLPTCLSQLQWLMIITYLSVSTLVISDYYLPVCLSSSDYWLLHTFCLSSSD